MSATRPTSYQLVIEVPAPVRCTVGRLGTLEFPAGSYVYTGSARRALEARLARHARREKTLRWHIDYLLAAEGVELFCIGRSARRECALNRSVGGEVVVPGFGASDCRKDCGSHLRYLGAKRTAD